MRTFAIAAFAAGVIVLSGCSTVQRTPPIQVWPDMRLQPRFEAQATSGLFVDGRASRRRPEGVVARGHLWEENVFNTGMQADGLYLGKSPVEITPAVLAEGEWRFNTYCAPCHDRTGLGKGMIPQHVNNAWQPADLTEQRLVDAADGDLFNVISFGRRTMPPYGAQNRPAERWAIVAYLRVLQRAQHGKPADVPASVAGLEYKPGPPPIETPSLDAPGTPGADKAGAKQPEGGKNK